MKLMMAHAVEDKDGNLGVQIHETHKACVAKIEVV